MSTRKPTVRKIDEVVAELMCQRGYAQAIANEELHNVWKAIVGSQLAGISRLGNIRKGVLDVFVGNSTANQELAFRRRELAKKLTEALPQYAICDLRIRVS